MTAGPLPHLQPPASAWSELLRRGWSRGARRDAGGAGGGGPVVMTGHQATFWHPGILAKYLAADALAGRVIADTAMSGVAAGSVRVSTAWVVVDQDRARSVAVRYPARDSAGTLVTRTLLLTSSTPAMPSDAHEAARPGLDRLLAAYAARSQERYVPRRVALATRDLVKPLLRTITEPPIVMASELLRAGAGVAGRSSGRGGELVDRMLREPRQAALAYNAAAARHPTARVRALRLEGDRVELPLWMLHADGTRSSLEVEVGTPLSAESRERLAPKALLMTAMLRLDACDLFIHGTGGGGGGVAAGAEDPHEGYDRVMEDWISQWIGEQNAALAPIAVATATRHLPLADRALPTPEEIAHASWLAHRARHDPGAVGDRTGASRRAELVAAIGAAGDRLQRAARFRELHDFENAVSARHAVAIEELARAAARLRGSRAQAEIAYDRTWAFALYPPQTLDELAAQIRRLFDA